MRWHVIFVGARFLRLVFACLGFGLNSRRKHTFGPVRNTDSKARTRAMRLSEREVLIATIRHRQRSHLSTSDLRRKLVRLTAEIAAE